MPIEIRVPALGESVTEATVGQWFKKAGEAVSVDEPVVELETDKVTVEVPAPAAGVLSEIVVDEGDTVEVGTLLAAINDGAASSAASSGESKPEPVSDSQASAARELPRVASTDTSDEMPLTPAGRKIADEQNIDTAQIEGTGKRGQVLKGDILSALESGSLPSTPRPVTSSPTPSPTLMRTPAVPADGVREERVRMTKLRQTIAQRLKDAQNTAAMLTTFNEVDMSEIIALRKEYKDLFEKKHGVKLGFMGFFVKACVQALKEIPAVNAEIDGTDLVYKNYYHIGVAVGTERGLVVPVVRDADELGLADIEKAINDFGSRAREGKLGLEEMQGGTFTISNGGVYGSLMSTPILNAPQSGILGMHKIQERPAIVNGDVVARPMMYLALSYDHRIVDGKEAVTFLVRVKEVLEDPQRMVLDL